MTVPPRPRRRRRKTLQGKQIFWLIVTLVSAVALIWGGYLYMDTLRRTSETSGLDGNAEDAARALEVLLASKTGKEQEDFLAQTAKATNPGLRVASLEALASRKAVTSMDTFEIAMTDSASQARIVALHSIPKLDGQNGLWYALACLRDEDIWVRETAVNLLSMPVADSPFDPTVRDAKPKNDIDPSEYSRPILADKRSIPMLMTALEDDSLFVRMKVTAILAKLTKRGKKIRKIDPEAEQNAVIQDWKTWWDERKAKWKSDSLTDIAPIIPTRSDSTPSIRIEDIDKRVLVLPEQQGRITLLNFWGTWCAPCVEEVQVLQQLHSDYFGKGLDVVGLAMNESGGVANLRQFMEKHKINYRQALCTDEVSRLFGDIHEVPVSILIDKQGKIRHRWEGERDYNTFSKAVERLLKE